jgi:hypothetical protein
MANVFAITLLAGRCRTCWYIYGDSKCCNILGGSPTYLLEHLATFTVSPENDLVYPADGMRRLLAMEKTSGIWTQKVRSLNQSQPGTMKRI